MSAFELRWRLFGLNFAIKPSFWIVSALFGLMLMQHLRGQNNLLLYILLWVLCTLVSVMVHELGHAVTGALFGQPGNITLAGLGGQASGNFDKLKSWQRALVILAGPGAGFLFLALQTFINSRPWDLLADAGNFPNLKLNWDLLVYFRHDPWRFEPLVVVDILTFLCWMNLFWNLINLIPIIPLDGGMLMREGCMAISPLGGLKFALGISFLLAGLGAMYHLAIVLKNYKVISMPVELPTVIMPELAVIMFGMMAYQSFSSLLQVGRMQRDERYRDPEED